MDFSLIFGSYWIIDRVTCKKFVLAGADSSSDLTDLTWTELNSTEAEHGREQRKSWMSHTSSPTANSHSLSQVERHWSEQEKRKWCLSSSHFINIGSVCPYMETGSLKLETHCFLMRCSYNVYVFILVTTPTSCHTLLLPVCSRKHAHTSSTLSSPTL